MIIQVNGEPRETAGPLTIGALLAQLDIDPRRVAVEHNLIVLKRDLYDTTVVGDGDAIEIVNFVGGGQDVETGGQDDSQEGRSYSTGGQELRRLLSGPVARSASGELDCVALHGETIPVTRMLLIS